MLAGCDRVVNRLLHRPHPGAAGEVPWKDFAWGKNSETRSYRVSAWRVTARAFAVGIAAARSVKSPRP
jgi:hypothetical protein